MNYQQQARLDGKNWNAGLRPDALHPLAWLAWLGAILVALSMTRNPFYLALLLLWIALVTTTLRATSAAIPVSPLRFGLVVVTFSAIFNAVTVHFGRTVLLRLPQLLPVIGGVITLEALVFGLLNGLALAAIFAAFTAFNQALPVRAVVRLIPGAFYPIAVVVSIAVTFAPATLRQLQQIREAQAVRGHRLRGWRDWLPLWGPLLVGGLERALQLAEAMTARGFASSDTPSHDAKTRLTLVLGLSMLLSGWLLRLVWEQATVGLLLLLLGSGLVLSALWVVGRRVPRTVYRPEPWRRHDALVLLGAVIVVAVFLWPWPGLDQTSIFYYPYPTLTWPGFDPALALATLGLSGPVWILHKGSRE